MSKPHRDLNVKIPENILKDLLTTSESRMLKNRWQITKLLEEGLSIRKIATQVKVGTDTVVRTSRLVEKNNILSKANKKEKTYKTLTPWIFGKSND